MGPRLSAMDLGSENRSSPRRPNHMIVVKPNSLGISKLPLTRSSRFLCVLKPLCADVHPQRALFAGGKHNPDSVQRVKMPIHACILNTSEWLYCHVPMYNIRLGSDVLHKRRWITINRIIFIIIGNMTRRRLFKCYVPIVMHVEQNYKNICKILVCDVLKP